MVQMVQMVWLQQISYIIIISTNCCSYIFSQKSLPGGVPDQALLLAVGVVGHHHDGHGGLNTTNFTYYYHPKHFLFLQLCPKITPWVCPWWGSTPGCWSGWTPAWWSWWSEHNKFHTSSSSQTTLVLTSLPKNHSLRVSLIMLYSWLSEGLDTTQLVLVVWKHVQVIRSMILKNSLFYTLAKKPIPKGWKCKLRVNHSMPIVMVKPYLAEVFF